MPHRVPNGNVCGVAAYFQRSNEEMVFFRFICLTEHMPVMRVGYGCFNRAKLREHFVLGKNDKGFIFYYLYEAMSIFKL